MFKLVIQRGKKRNDILLYLSSNMSLIPTNMTNFCFRFFKKILLILVLLNLICFERFFHYLVIHSFFSYCVFDY